ARRRRRVRSRAGAIAASPVREIAAIDVPLLPQQLQSLFDPLPDVVFFVKDADCRYAHVNQTLIQRLGLPRREDILGKSVLELYPASLSATYIAQDRRVLAGEVIENLLELQLYPNRMRGWCLTFKQPLYQDGRIAGLIGISRDLGQPDNQHSSYARLQQAVSHMQAHFHDPLRVQTLATIAGVSVSQLERLFKRVFQITPQRDASRTPLGPAREGRPRRGGTPDRPPGEGGRSHGPPRANVPSLWPRSRRTAHQREGPPPAMLRHHGPGHRVWTGLSNTAR